MGMNENRGKGAGKYPAWLRILFLLIVLGLGGSGAYSQLGDTDSGEIAARVSSENSRSEAAEVTFRNTRLLEEHYEKHGIEMGFASAEEYEKAASAVVQNPGSLHKTEKEDGDDVYYLEDTNEFVIVSTDGYIRTYFSPEGGKSYFNRQ